MHHLLHLTGEKNKSLEIFNNLKKKDYEKGMENKNEDTAESKKLRHKAYTKRPNNPKYHKVYTK